MSLPAISEKTTAPGEGFIRRPWNTVRCERRRARVPASSARIELRPPAPGFPLGVVSPIQLGLADTDANPARCPLPPGGVMERPILQTPGWATPSSLRSCLLLTALESIRLSSFESRRTI